MQNQQIDLKSKTVPELKAMVYDLSKGIANSQQAIQIVEREISEREALQAKPATNGKGVEPVAEVPQTLNN